MLLKIVQAGDPVLRMAARPLSVDEIRAPGTRTLIELMRETMRDAPGVGLAAPQIGESIQLAVIEDRPAYQQHLSDEDRVARGRAPIPFHVIINPRLHFVDEAPADHFEGCLSLRGMSALVARATTVRVEALDHEGRPVEITASGWYARILQHEIDHLAGHLYIDRAELRTLSVAENAHHTHGFPPSEVRRALACGPARLLP